jgi:hypothetical protein
VCLIHKIRCVRFLFATAACVATLSACGSSASSAGSSSPNSTTASSPTDGTVADATSTASSTQPAVPSVNALMTQENLTAVTIQLRGSEGATAKATFSYGAPERASASMRDGLAALGEACGFDEQTTAVEPFVLTLANTTPHFSETPSIIFNLGSANLGGSGPPWNLYAATYYSSGAQCTNFGANHEYGGPTSTGLSPNTPLTDGGSPATVFGFLAMDGFYSPAHPNGDPSGLEDFLIDFEGGTGWEVVDPQAPDMHGAFLTYPIAPGGKIR